MCDTNSTACMALLAVTVGRRYVACMNPTAGSFVVNPRLQRLFMTLAVEFPGQESLMKIYGTFVTGHFKKFSADVQVCLLCHVSCFNTTTNCYCALTEQHRHLSNALAIQEILS